MAAVMTPHAPLASGGEKAIRPQGACRGRCCCARHAHGRLPVANSAHRDSLNASCLCARRTACAMYYAAHSAQMRCGQPLTLPLTCKQAQPCGPQSPTLARTLAHSRDRALAHSDRQAICRHRRHAGGCAPCSIPRRAPRPCPPWHGSLWCCCRRPWTARRARRCWG